MANQYDLFISHATRIDADARNLIDTIVDRLRTAGFAVFLDRDSLPMGCQILPFLDDIIDRSASALVVASRRSIHSGWVAVERQRLRERQLAGDFPIVVLHVEDGSALPEGLEWADVILVNDQADCAVVADRIRAHIPTLRAANTAEIRPPIEQC